MATRARSPPDSSCSFLPSFLAGLTSTATPPGSPSGPGSTSLRPPRPPGKSTPTMCTNCSCTAANVSANSSSICAVSSLMSASRSSIDLSRSRRCSRRKAARSPSSAHSASASGLTGPMRSRRRSRRSSCSRRPRSSSSSSGGANPAWSSSSLTSSSAAASSPRRSSSRTSGDLHRGAPLAGLVELAAQRGLLLGQRAQLAAVERARLLAGVAEALDQSRRPLRAASRPAR